MDDLHKYKIEQLMAIHSVVKPIVEPIVEPTTMESTTMESTIDDIIQQIKDESYKLLSQLQTIIVVHHYDWVDELDNWIQGNAWVQEYNGYDNYYSISTLGYSKEEIEIEQFDDNFYQWQVDELAKPGSP